MHSAIPAGVRLRTERHSANETSSVDATQTRNSVEANSLDAILCWCVACPAFEIRSQRAAYSLSFPHSVGAAHSNWTHSN
jgi:hypothetical protein